MNTMGKHNDVILPPYMFINKKKLDYYFSLIFWMEFGFDIFVIWLFLLCRNYNYHVGITYVCKG